MAITDDDVDTAQWVETVCSALAAVKWPQTTTDGRELAWELYALAGRDYLEAVGRDGRALRVQLQEITPGHVSVTFPFDDLAGIGYQNEWLAECRDSGCIVDTTEHT
ncbi:MAG: hypothetical protein KGY43_07225 [Halodesulfurarchaeum sp.]|nr:hypothetical protein [Halodesulfurarchaeum sp.]